MPEVLYDLEMHVGQPKHVGRNYPAAGTVYHLVARMVMEQIEPCPGCAWRRSMFFPQTPNMSDSCNLWYHTT